MADIQAEVKKIKQKIRERNRPKPKTLPSGDRGQRYAVMARLNGSDPLCLGWSEQSTGGQLSQAALIHAEWSDLRIVDRDPGKRRQRVLSLVTCRKCVEQFDAGRDRCEYCGNVFAVSPTHSDPSVTGEVVRCGHCQDVLDSLTVAHECEKKTTAEAAKREAVEAFEDERRGNDRFVARQERLKVDRETKEGLQSGGLSEKAGA